MKTRYDIDVETTSSDTVSLASYREKVLLTIPMYQPDTRGQAKQYRRIKRAGLV
jgi:hypothetical protein